MERGVSISVNLKPTVFESALRNDLYTLHFSKVSSSGKRLGAICLKACFYVAVVWIWFKFVSQRSICWKLGPQCGRVGVVEPLNETWWKIIRS